MGGQPEDLPDAKLLRPNCLLVWAGYLFGALRNGVFAALLPCKEKLFLLLFSWL